MSQLIKKDEIGTQAILKGDLALIESFITQIKTRLELITRLSEKAFEKTNMYPAGRIKIKHRNYGTYYYHSVQDKADKFIDNSQLIEDLIQKSYLEKVIKSAQNEIEVLNTFLDKYPKTTAEDVYNQLTDDRKKWVKPIIPTDEQFVTDWQNKPYTPKPFKKGTPYFETLKGERVRSKSEVIIADRLYTSGIPYKYECPLLVGQDVFYPDFTILRVSDRKILYLEHNGKVGDQEYGDDMVDRLNKYSLAGIMQNDKLYFTFESANRPFDVRVLDKMINEVFR